MSALPPKADMGYGDRHGRFVPTTDIGNGRRMLLTVSSPTNSTATALSTASRSRGLMVKPGDARIGGALAVLPRSPNGAPEGLVDSFAGKPNDVV